jgi:V8-like Glu-specific endopeptidase
MKNRVWWPRAVLAGSAVIAMTLGLSAGAASAKVAKPASVTTVTKTHAISVAIDPAAQAAALAYWTPARMESATPFGSSAPAVTARSFSGLRSVGALFYTIGQKTHFCTASVINSPQRDLVLTAAHCVYHGGKSVTNIAFVPEYHSGNRPYGTYAVEASYLLPGWVYDANIDADFAFLKVKGAVQNRVRAALKLGINQSISQKMVAIGYNNTSSSPIWCPTKSFQPKGLPSQEEFQCDGFWNGTSGGPWIEGSSLNADGTVFGGIGGYQQGGNSPNYSYSPKFNSLIELLYVSATI